MGKFMMTAAAAALSAGASLAFAAGATAASEARDVRGGLAVSDSGQQRAGPVDCDIPMFGWANCQVVKIRADDLIEVKLHDATAIAQVDCNLNELETDDQLNAITASMAIGEQRFLWHNNTSGTVYADLRCASPNWAGFTATLEAIALE